MSCQIDYLCELPDDRERCRALESLPPDLKSTYERILKRVDEKHILVRRLVQRTLRWLVVARGELTISALREALPMKDGISKLDRAAVPHEFDLLRWCSSLVRKSASGRELELAHYTVKEFLLGIEDGNEFSDYRIDVEESEVELGKACLTHLTLQDFNSRLWWSRKAQQKRIQEYAFRRYAVRNWVFHASDRLGDPRLFTLIQKLLDPSNPETFATWTLDYQTLDSEIFAYTSKWQPKWSRTEFHEACITVRKETPLHYASAFALPEVCKWLLDCGCKVDHMSRFGTPLHNALDGPDSLGVGFAKSVLVPERREDHRRKVIDILLEAGADPNSESSQGHSPLFYAFTDPDIILRLLQRGARYNNEGAYPPICPERASAGIILDRIGRENLHEDDYAFLLKRSTRA